MACTNRSVRGKGEPIMTTPHIPDWDPRAPSVLDDQRHAYDEMRRRCPVAYSDLLGWSLFRYDDVLRALEDPGAFSSATKHRAIPNGLDGPEHTAYRRLLAPHFGPDRLDALEPRARQIAAGLLQPLLARGAGELVSEFAQPFAMHALCEFVGWPHEDWQQLAEGIRASQNASFTKDAGAGAAAAGEFVGYVNGVLAAHRAAPTEHADGLTAALLESEIAGARLSDDDIVSILRNVTAGHGTTAAAVGVVALHLADDPRLQETLRIAPSLLPVAIREILRIDDPLVALGRTTKRAVEILPVGSHAALGRTSTRDMEIGGRAIRSGDRISLMWIAANRDEATFPEADTLRLDRDSTADVVFGAGIHRCLGEALALLEIQTAIEALLDGTRRIAFAGTEPRQRAVYPGNGLRALPLELSPR